MKNILNNTGYFLKEAMSIIKMNKLSNMLSILSTGFIFFMLALVIAGSMIISRTAEVIKGYAEIDAYFNENIKDDSLVKLSDDIKSIDGVKQVRMVDKKEAYMRMAEILGKDADVLKFFDENPFSPFFEINIDIGKTDSILKNLNEIKGIEYIRDNKDILDRIKSISDTLKLLTYIISAAAGISTLVIISHIIRLGIHNNFEEINTLRLLGAPDIFIAFPFVLEGLLLTLGGGVLAAILSNLALKLVYEKAAGPLPFIPMPSFSQISFFITMFLILLSLILGALGSLSGFVSAKN